MTETPIYISQPRKQPRLALLGDGIRETPRGFATLAQGCPSVHLKRIWTKPAYTSPILHLNARGCAVTRIKKKNSEPVHSELTSLIRTDSTGLAPGASGTVDRVSHPQPQRTQNRCSTTTAIDLLDPLGPSALRAAAQKKMPVSLLISALRRGMELAALPSVFHGSVQGRIDLCAERSTLFVRPTINRGMCHGPAFSPKVTALSMAALAFERGTEDLDDAEMPELEVVVATPSEHRNREIMPRRNEERIAKPSSGTHDPMEIKCTDLSEVVKAQGQVDASTEQETRVQRGLRSEGKLDTEPTIIGDDKGMSPNAAPASSNGGGASGTESSISQYPFFDIVGSSASGSESEEPKCGELSELLHAMALTTRDRSQATMALSSAPGVPTGDVAIPQCTRGYPESPELISAHRQLECALVLDPNNIDARLARADLRRATGNTAGALRDLKAASTQEPALLETHIMRAVLFINYMHDFDSGKSAAKEAHVPHRVPEFFDMSSARGGACMIGGCTPM